MKEPKDVAVNSGFTIPDEGGDRFGGYAIIGLPFSSGHVLAMRRWEASSVGPAYTSVWHRDPEGRWTFHQNVAPEQSCPRYFGAAVSENTTEPIRIEWTGPREFRVTVDSPGEIDWYVRLQPTLVTRLMNRVGSAIPSRWWRNRGVIFAMETAARCLLRAGKLNLTGSTPNGQEFTATPRLVWFIEESRAVIRGVAAGSPGPLASQAMLADFLIPQRGVFAIATAALRPGKTEQPTLAA